MNLEILQYKKKNVSEGIDVNKINASKKCMLCHYWCFKEVGFKLEPHVCNKYQGVWMTACDLTHIAILSVGGAGFRCILWGISKNEAVNRLNNSVLKHKGVL